jgi:hypothetical protein
MSGVILMPPRAGASLRRRRCRVCRGTMCGRLTAT